MKPTTTRWRLQIGMALCVAALPAHAGGPLDLCSSAVPFLWPDGGRHIPFNPDRGGLGELGNAEATALVESAFEAWAEVPTSTVSYSNAGPLPLDVDAGNFFQFLFPGTADGFSPVVYDDDGGIFDLLFGPGSGILGFAGPDVYLPESCTIAEGAAFLNGPAIETEEGLLDLMVHEFGHYTNLAHSVVNGQMYLGDSSGPSPDFTFGPPPDPFSDDGVFDVIETMYPFFFFGVDQRARTLHRDDIAIVSTLYPERGFEHASGSVGGTITVRGRELSGINVIARNVAAPFADAASAISGDATRGAPPTGDYAISGLTPGATYAVFIDRIEEGGFSTPPRPQLPGPEEFHNVAGVESDIDDPLQFDGVTVAAGVPSRGIDVILNHPRPGTPLQVGDDGSVELFLPFEFPMCGEEFESVFVNANGNLTFGTANSQFVENVPDLLHGPPRIAGLWRDLTAFDVMDGTPQGVVSYSETPFRLTVAWQGVPEFPDVGANSFNITLHRLLGIIEIETDDVTATNGLIGISCGGAFTSRFEQETDFSALLDSRGCGRDTACLPVRSPAVFEHFDSDDYDLQNTRFIGATLPFRDFFEPNDTPARARPVRLPFSSLPEIRFTDIRPRGGDVDWFEARNLFAGETLVAQVLSGQIDSVLGVFDANGNPLAVDDDGGAGLLSRVEVPIPADGTYLIAVSTYPDLDFDGDGNEDPILGLGRYVLDVEAIAEPGE